MSAPTSEPRWWAPMAAALIPVLQVGPTLGSWKAPGVRAEPLFATLVGARDLLLTGSPLGTACVRFCALFLDPVSSLGAVDALGLWLAGYGGWRLGRRAGLPGAVLGMALLQLSPIVLRGLCTGEVGVLAIGLGALALATERAGAVWALLACLTSWPVGLLALAGRARCRRTLALCVPALLLLAFSPISAEPGALRGSPDTAVSVYGYVTEAGAVIPLPAAVGAAEQGARGLARGLHGGVVALVGVVLALVLGPRAPGLVGAGVFALIVVGLGPLPGPGAPPPLAASWLAALSPPGLGEAGVPWGAAVALAGALGWISLVQRRAAAVWVAGAAGLFSALVENPRLSLPVANVPPDPGVNALASVGPGPVVIFPSPQRPWRQSGRGPAEHRWYAPPSGRAEASGAPAAAVIGRLSAVAGVPVDLAGAQAIWESRALTMDDALDAGVPYLLLDLRSLPAESKGPLEGWLATTIGPPLAKGDDYALYTIEMEGKEGSDSE